jgi:hypothetical protein
MLVWFVFITRIARCGCTYVKPSRGVFGLTSYPKQLADAKKQQAAQTTISGMRDKGSPRTPRIDTGGSGAVARPKVRTLAEYKERD